LALTKAINERATINIGVVSGASDVVFGQYISGRVDITDISGAGAGRGVSSAALLAHEIAEQTQKQSLGLASDRPGFAVAHPFGLAAQQSVSGYRRIAAFETLNSQNTGAVGGTHQRGNDTVTPCRVLDTRTQSAPLAAGETRTVTMAGTCGIPSNATAVSVNLTVVDASVQGELTAYPANEPRI
jgi:hypothetical protein